MTVVMREQISFWQVACRNLPEAECIKIVRVFTAARTAPPGPSPTPTPAPVILTAGEVVTEAVYADASVGADATCPGLVPYMVPASAMGKGLSRAVACQVGPVESLNYQFILGADGVSYLYRASIIALTATMVPGVRPDPVDCREVADYFAGLSRPGYGRVGHRLLDRAPAPPAMTTGRLSESG